MTALLHSPDHLSFDEAVMHSVAAADMIELAETFSKEKSLSILSGFGLESTGDDRYDSFTAAALVIDIIDADWYSKASKKETPSSADLDTLFSGVDSFYNSEDSGEFISDAGVFSAVLEDWNNYALVQSLDLLDTVDEAVIRSIVTGYNVLETADHPGYAPELTITYGHSDIKHALQLLALLDSEGLDAEVAFLGKTSAFLYLKEWGEPTESDTFQVKQIPNGNYVAYSKEYNLIFQFKTVEEKNDFDRVILAYAKKDSADEPGLIYGSWWQPLYFSTTPMGEGYRTITDHVILDGDYEAHPFSLNERAEEVDAGFMDIDPSVNLNSVEFWVNQAFYNYLTGEFK